jgi:hypothetical protein
VKKAFLFFITVFALCIVDIGAQENIYSIDDVLNTLNSDFEKYPWAHLYYNRKIHDNGRPYVKFLSQAYENGEVVNVEIRKGGWRYEVKINFISEKQIYAKRTYDIKMAIYQMISEVLPDMKQDDGV